MREQVEGGRISHHESYYDCKWVKCFTAVIYCHISSNFEDIFILQKQSKLKNLQACWDQAWMILQAQPKIWRHMGSGNPLYKCLHPCMYIIWYDNKSQWCSVHRLHVYIYFHYFCTPDVNKIIFKKKVYFRRDRSPPVTSYPQTEGNSPSYSHSPTSVGAILGSILGPKPLELPQLQWMKE